MSAPAPDPAVPAPGPGDEVVIDRAGLDALLQVLAGRGYRTIGPVVADGAIGLGPVAALADLPGGWHDTQAPGRYRLHHDDDPALFSWAVGPASTKREAFPPHRVLWRARATGSDVDLEVAEDGAVPTAHVGARPCEVAAMAVLDRVLGQGAVPDPHYRRHRPAFVAVVECGTPSGSCFCPSMGTGPAAGGAFDLALTELLDGGRQRFMVRPGSPLGSAVLAEIPATAADEEDRAARRRVLAGAEERMGRRLDADGLPGLLADTLEHPWWDEVAERCLSCGNCTLVCPTCFCATVADTTDVWGEIRRERTWASCFDLDHSAMHGGPVRATVRSRYRQWMTHKLSTWWDQFGTSGCVGCGRCITWCPVGIDLTEGAAAIRADPGAAAGATVVTAGDGAAGGAGRSPTGDRP